MDSCFSLLCTICCGVTNSLKIPYYCRDCRKSSKWPFFLILGVIKSNSCKAQNWCFRVFRQPRKLSTINFRQPKFIFDFECPGRLTKKFQHRFGMSHRVLTYWIDRCLVNVEFEDYATFCKNSQLLGCWCRLQDVDFFSFYDPGR